MKKIIALFTLLFFCGGCFPSETIFNNGLAGLRLITASKDVHSICSALSCMRR